MDGDDGISLPCCQCRALAFFSPYWPLRGSAWLASDLLVGAPDLSKLSPIHELRQLEGWGPYQASLDLFPRRQRVPHINEAKSQSQPPNHAQPEVIQHEINCEGETNLSIQASDRMTCNTKSARGHKRMQMKCIHV